MCGYGGSSVLAAGCAAVVQGGRECGEHKQQYCLDVHNWFENQLLHGRLWSRCRNADLSRSTWNRYKSVSAVQQSQLFLQRD